MRSVLGYPRAICPTLFFLCALILAFFPNLFIGVLKLPFSRYTKPPASSPQNGASRPYSPPSMSWFQKTIQLPARSRGSYLITDTIVSELPEIKNYKIGILHLFVQHTSCALSMNENWDDDVRADMSDALDRIVPEDKKGNLYRHSAEGSDDMPAHVKSALIGSSVSIPIKDGRLATGTWQGIWYLEFRSAKHSRNVVATMQGERM
jgi:secondary thiamine-phosphate synthase enzyme